MRDRRADPTVRYDMRRGQNVRKLLRRIRCHLVDKLFKLISTRERFNFKNRRKSDALSDDGNRRTNRLMSTMIACRIRVGDARTVGKVILTCQRVTVLREISKLCRLFE